MGLNSCTTNLAEKAFDLAREALMDASGANSLLDNIDSMKAGILAKVKSMAPGLGNVPNLAGDLESLKEKIGTSEFLQGATDLYKKWGSAVGNLQEMINGLATLDLCSVANIDAKSTNPDGSYSVKVKAPDALNPAGMKPSDSPALETTSEDEKPAVYDDTRKKYAVYQAELKSILSSTTGNISFMEKEEELDLALFNLKARAAFSNMDAMEYVERHSDDVSGEEHGAIQAWKDLEAVREKSTRDMSTLTTLASGFEKAIGSRPGDDLAALRAAYDSEVGRKHDSVHAIAKKAGDKIQENAQVIRDFHQFGTQGSSVSVTGFAAPKGARITAYGYEKPGDKYYDSNSGKGIGIKNLRLSPGDFAVSPDIRKVLEANKINHTQYLQIRLSNGMTLKGRWRDVTATYLSGRVDIYSPSGVPSYDGTSVIGFGVLPKDDPTLIAQVRP